MKISKSLIYKAGDPIKLVANVPIKEGYGYQQGVVYDGKIISHQEGYSTLVEIIGDNGQIVETSVNYDIFNDGMESITLTISESELADRLDAWIDLAVADETARHEAKVIELKGVTFL